MCNFKLKKVIAIVTLICICVSMPSFGVMADDIVSEQDYVFDVAPYNIAITKRDYDFVINSDGKAQCYGEVTVCPEYTVKLVMQLQKKSSMWTTVQSWSETNSSFVVLDKEYSVEKGYSYRLMNVYIAYDSQGNQVESFYDISDVIEY